MTGSLRRTARLLAPAACLVVCLTACSDDDPADEAEPSPTASESTPGTLVTPTSPTSPATSETVGTSPTSDPNALEDGRHPAYITAVDTGAREITVDVVQWFFGDAAAEAAEEDDAPEVPPPNDVWIRNENPLLRTLEVTADAKITVNTLTAGETGDATEDVVVDLERLAGFEDLEHHLFWVTMADGEVTRIREQYLP